MAKITSWVRSKSTSITPLPVDVPTLYRGPSIDLRFASKSGQKVSRRADSNRFPLLITSDNLGVAEDCTGLHIPHFQATFSALICPVVHRIAFPVASEWCHYAPPASSYEARVLRAALSSFPFASSEGIKNDGVYLGA